MDDVTDTELQETFEFDENAKDVDTFETEPIANWSYTSEGPSLEQQEEWRQESIRGRRERFLGLALTKFEGHEITSILSAARAFEDFVQNG